MLKIVAFFLLVHYSLLVPGFVIASRIPAITRIASLKLIFSYVISIVLLSLLALAYYILPLPSFLVSAAFVAFLAVITTLFFQHHLYRELKQFMFPLAALLAMSALSLAFIALPYRGDRAHTPDPEIRTDRNYNVFHVKILNIAQTNANDNYIPFRQAQFVLNRSNPAKDSFIEEWGVHFFQRTPLMGFVSAGFFLGLQEKLPLDYTWSNTVQNSDNLYIQFQIIAQILNSLFIISAYFFIKKVFSSDAARITALFIIPSQFFIYNSFFSWPKSLVAFFVFALWLALEERGKAMLMLAGIAAGMAYLTHDLAILYIAATVVVLLIQKRIRDMLIILAISTGFALPWVFTSAVIFKKPSSFILFPFSLHGIPQTSQRGAILKEFFSTPILTHITGKLGTVYYLLSPYQLLHYDPNQSLPLRLWAVGLFSIPGAVGIGLIVPALLGMFRWGRKYYQVLLLAFLPVVFSTILIGWPNALGAFHFAEAVVVLIMAFGGLMLAKVKLIWTYIAYLLTIIQLAFFMVFSLGGRTALSNYTLSQYCLVGIAALIVAGVLVCLWMQRKYTLLDKYL